MHLPPTRLADALKKGLAPLYLVCGDEPLQLMEAAAEIRQAVRAAGFSEREVLTQDGQFDWSELAGAAGSLSLFAERRLLELRLSTAKIGRDGSAAVRAFCEQPADDLVLLVLAPQLDRNELKAKWVQAIDRAGVVVQVRSIPPARLGGWLDARLRQAGFVPEPGVADLLAERVEGNLLAGAQQIEILKLLCDPGPLSLDDLLSRVADSARFDLFALTDAALAGNRARVARVLRGLEAEGTAAPLVLWVLAREIRLLAQVARAQAGGGSLHGLFRELKVWDARQGPVSSSARRLGSGRLQALVRRCERVDRCIKGLDSSDPWLLMARIGDALAGGPMPGVHG